MKNRRINKRYEPELVNIVMISIFVFIVALLLANCYSENPVFSSFVINVSVSALTVLFTVVFVDRLLKRVQKRNELELEQIIGYQNYKLELENDKQNTAGHLLEIKDMIDIISKYYLIDKDSSKDDKKCTCNALFLDYLKLKLMLKLKTLPRRPSFNAFATVRVHNTNNLSTVHDITIKLEKITNEIVKQIGNGHLGKNELFQYESDLFDCAGDILTIVPRKFEDIKEDL